MGKMIGVAVLLAGVLLASMSLFTVKEWEKAIRLQLGEIVQTDYAPGLHMKMPFVNNVRKFDARILTLDAEAEEYLTSEKKYVSVDSFVKWRIIDVAKYYTAMGGSEFTAAQRLGQIIKKGLRDEFGKRTIQEVISGERAQIMDILRTDANKQAYDFGIEIVDVRIKRIEWPEKVAPSVYRRMEAERLRVAKELRAEGDETAKKIAASADKNREILLAEAARDAERYRGEGDGKAAKIYADSFGANIEFYTLYRSLNAYKTTFADKGNILLLQPDSDFFRFFKDPSGKR